MFRSMLKAVALFICCTVVSYAQTTSGTISSNETWSGTVNLTGTVTITGGTVTISPGATVKLPGGADIEVQAGGSVNAVGTAQNPITITSAASSPQAGAWSAIKLRSNTSSVFTHCVIEYGMDGFNLNASTTSLTNCTIRYIKGSGIFADGGSGLTIESCVFDECVNSVFFNTVATVSITNTSISNTSTGIILAGGGTENITINHCSIAGVDMRKSASPQWWTGYGVFCCNTGATLRLHNTIVALVAEPAFTQYGFSTGSWSVARDYNCWFGGKGAIDAGGSPSGNDVSADPVFVDIAGADLRLRDTSPCIDQANDGTHMGSWQGTPVSENALYMGRVTDAGNGQGVGGAMVLIKGTTNQTNTDQDGYFALYEQTTPIKMYVPHIEPAMPGIYFDQGRQQFILHSKGEADLSLHNGQGVPAGRRINNGKAWQLPDLPSGMYYLTVTMGDHSYRNKVLWVNNRLCGLKELAPSHKGTRLKAAATEVLVISRRGYTTREITVTTGDQNVQAALTATGLGDYFVSDFLDLQKTGMFVDNYKWQVSTALGTGGNLFTLDNVGLSETHPGETRKGFISLTVRANVKEGAEIICTEETKYGYYEVRMKCSNVWGACNAFFWINQDTHEEIDCEFLTPDFYNKPANQGTERCQLHPGNLGGPQALPFNPSVGFHRIGFLWQPGKLEWTADGQVIQTITGTSSVPKNAGRMFFNNWTGNPNWGGGPPAFDNTMWVDWARFHPDATSIVAVPAELQ